jgi:hypothetical protein
MDFPGEPGTDVGPETVKRGIELVEYSRSHADRVLPAFNAKGAGRSAGLSIRMERKITDEWISRKELRTALGGTGFSVEEFDTAIDELVARGKIERESEKTPGRPREKYRVLLSPKSKGNAEAPDLGLTTYFDEAYFAENGNGQGPPLRRSWGCPACGANVSNDLDYCLHCGAARPAPVGAQS